MKVYARSFYRLCTNFWCTLQSREELLGGDAEKSSPGSKPGVTLTWRDLSVYAKIRNEKFFQVTSTEYRKLVNNGKSIATVERSSQQSNSCLYINQRLVDRYRW